MEIRWDRNVDRRLQEFLAGVGAILGNDARRASFAQYAMGLLGEGERKSIEPIAARCCPDPDETGAVHQRLQHFVTNSRWDDHAVRRYAAHAAVAALTKREPVVSWIVDDTGFLKQGSHSVGVQRQYTGAAGKITNCQLGTSLVVTTRTMHVAIDFELYLPRSWTDDPERRREGRIPSAVEFRTKPQQALEMIQRAVTDGIPSGVVLADSGFGDSNDFRDGVRALGLHFAVGIEGTTGVWCADEAHHTRDTRLSVEQLARRLRLNQKAFRRVTWREGTRRDLWSRFALIRVVPAAARRLRRTQPESEPVWLLVEWPDGEPGPTHYFFVSLDGLSRKQMVRLVKERYRTEAAYAELKGELGLDHFEGRRYRGWHHHVTVTLACHAFLVAEQARLFFSTARRTAHADPLPVAARASLPRQPRDRSPRDSSGHRPAIPATMSGMSRQDPCSISQTSPEGECEPCLTQ
jgi:SRSO17 transposase